MKLGSPQQTKIIQTKPGSLLHTTIQGMNLGNTSAYETPSNETGITSAYDDSVNETGISSANENPSNETWITFAYDKSRD